MNVSAAQLDALDSLSTEDTLASDPQVREKPTLTFNELITII